jgi:hypothetical protein
MELDIDIRLNDFPRAVALEIAQRLPVEFKTATEAAHQQVLIRAAQEPRAVTDIDGELLDFLRSLATYAETLRQSKGTLRLGIFYDLDETVVFPLRLSLETIKVLGDLNLSLDATGYPCSDESQEQ